MCWRSLGIADDSAFDPAAAPSHGNPLISWLVSEVSEPHADYLEDLCTKATVTVRELSSLMVFPDLRSLLASLLLSDFASCKGLCVAEAAMLLYRPASDALEAVDFLCIHAPSRVLPN